MDYPARLLAISDISWISIALIIVFLLVSSFFSMSETVFSSLNIIRIRTFIEDHKKGSKKAYWIHDHFDLTLSTILVGNNLANIALATISVGVFSRIFENSETLVMVFNTFVMTTIILIFGEIIPKSLAKKHSDVLALKISGFLYIVIKLLRPITAIFILIKSWFIKPDNRVTISVTEDELETIIDTMEEEGSIDEDEAEMLQSVLDLSQRKVYEIMTPRVDMIAIEVEDTLEEIKEVFFEHQFSRLPVYEEYRDNVIGVLTERDFFTCLIKGESFKIREMMKTPIFVSKSMRVDTLIETLQRENSHLAIVSDEFGGTSGIVTMEDALEELVGEIYDEHDDIDEDHLKMLNENEYGVNADMYLADLFEELEIGNPPSSDKTIGAWLYDIFEDIPEVDMTYTMQQKLITYHHNETPKVVQLTFIIKEIKDRRIKYVHIQLKEILELEERNEEE
ncbi:hemolysin family protein [Liberiplasma polymorphum]|uniref:hemolysin family protein n=1 Tax=Liberiplasma polymorphum TaxID=3374570 RepID=UPI0037728C20